MKILKSRLNYLNIAQIFLFFWLFSLFFPIKYVFPSHFSYQTGLYSDFTSFSLYLSDILLFITWIFVILPRGKVFYHVVIQKKPIKWLILWIFVLFFVNLNENWQLSLFFLGKTLELFVAYGTMAVLFKEKLIKTSFFSFFSVLCGIQSLISLNQFFIQKPIGLFRLGEQKIYAWQWGVAKLVSYGTTYIRGYGTFPHPNLLSAFLITGIIINIYLIFKNEKLQYQAMLSALLIINILGLTVTFSRAGYLAVAIGLAIFFGILALSHYFKTRITYGDKTLFLSQPVAMTISVILFSIILSFSLFHNLILTRATVSDKASLERGIYNHISLKMIKTRPIFGLGTGQSMLHMEQLSEPKLKPWEIQPIHNYFLLSAAELGIPGALILIWIFLDHLSSIWKLKITNLSHYQITLGTILVCFLILMMFDHYFYTLQQTQFLLWMTLALIAAETKNPPA